MRVLVIGSGAREHALLLALRADPQVKALAIAPGNAGTASIADQHDVDVSSADAVVALARQIHADLVVIGPEVPLVLGVADALRAAGIAAFGPGRDAAQIEGSKAFAKDVMAAAGVRTASSEIVDSPANLDAALDRFGPGTVIPPGWSKTTDWLRVRAWWSPRTAMSHARTPRACSSPGTRCCWSRSSTGPRCPSSALSTVTPWCHYWLRKTSSGSATATPAPTPEAWARIARCRGCQMRYTRSIVSDVVKPVAVELVRRGSPFSGLLYAGLAITSSGPAVIEFNCRFGDPETQAVLALLESPLGQLLNAAATGTLADFGELRWRDGAAVTVVLAAENYPGKPRTGDAIVGSEAAGVLHAGTARDEDGAIVSSGGRVLSVVGLGPDLAAARSAAYAIIDSIRLPGSHFRTDIGLAAAEGKIHL